MLHRVPPNENEVSPTQKYAVENLYDRVQGLLGGLLEHTSPSVSRKQEKADLKAAADVEHPLSLAKASSRGSSGERREKS